ncbi:hypothetical protein D3C73_1629240 [compost metagenome]
MITIDGISFLIIVAAIFAAPFFIGKAREHDARLQPVEPIDRDSLAEEADTRYEDDADAWRKGER